MKLFDSMELKELIKKVELQSVLVLFITLFAGCYLLRLSNSLSTPAGILGSSCIVCGILYTIVSFFSNQIRESYKDVIVEYKSHINTLKTSYGKVLDQMGLGQTSTSPNTNSLPGEYQVIDLGSETKSL